MAKLYLSQGFSIFPIWWPCAVVESSLGSPLPPICRKKRGWRNYVLFPSLAPSAKVSPPWFQIRESRLCYYALAPFYRLLLMLPFCLKGKLSKRLSPKCDLYLPTTLLWWAMSCGIYWSLLLWHLSPWLVMNDHWMDESMNDQYHTRTGFRHGDFVRIT